MQCPWALTLDLIWILHSPVRFIRLEVSDVARWIYTVANLYCVLPYYSLFRLCSINGLSSGIIRNLFDKIVDKIGATQIYLFLRD